MAKQAQLDEIRPALNKANKAASRVNKVLDAVDAGANAATDILEEGLETVADVVPEALDKGVHAATGGVRAGTNALTNPKRMVIALGVGGAVAGAALGVAGYFVMKKRLEKQMMLKFEARMDKEVENIRLFYAKRNKGEGFETPMQAAAQVGAPTIAVDDALRLAEAAGRAAAEYESSEPPVGVLPEGADPREGKNAKTPYHKIAVSRPSPGETVVEVTETTEPVEEAVVSRNVFEARLQNGWDQDREEAERDDEFPYIISIQEHNENLFSHEQTTLTYYVPDDMLMDERDEPINDVESLVGTVNLSMFGHGSGSEDTLYIRNEPKEIDLEILRRTDSYAEVVFARDSGG